jgi:exopolysaccharide biosynthesis polyprenyl glycosylphosphotransferase
MHFKPMASLPVNNKPAALRLRNTERRLILLIGDAFASGLALITALYLWAARDQWLQFSPKFFQERPPAWFWFLPFCWLILMIELYDVRRANRRMDTIRGIIIAGLVGTGLYLIVFFISPPDSLPRQGVATFIVGSVLLTLLWRMLFIRIFTAPLFMRRMLIVGAGRQGSELCVILRKMNPPPFFLAGLIDDDPVKQGTLVEGYPILGPGKQIGQVVREHTITDIIFAISNEINPELFRELLRIQETGVELTTMPIIYEELLGRVPIFLLQSDWILRSFVEQRTVAEFYEGMKRALDLIGGLVGTLIFVVSAPLVSLMILLETGWPVIFSQSRLGKNGLKYTIIKYRTMHKPKPDAPPRSIGNEDDRITRIGRFLRRSHLDELPQFLNVLHGEMSLVGPRAEQSELVDLFQDQIPFYRARLLVKPGITGWAQVNYGYASTVEETAQKLEYDLYYIKHRNIMLDLMILLRTFGTVVGLKGQ